LLPPWHLTDSLAHCWLPGILPGSLALLAPWLIVGSQSAGLIAGFDSLLPPWFTAGSLTRCRLPHSFSRLLVESLDPCWLPGSLLAHGEAGSSLAPWLIASSQGAWLTVSSLIYCCLPSTLLTPWFIVGSLGSLPAPWLLLVPWLNASSWETWLIAGFLRLTAASLA